MKIQIPKVGSEVVCACQRTVVMAAGPTFPKHKPGPVKKTEAGYNLVRDDGYCVISGNACDDAGATP